jgi:thiamine biosynthesis lipoprotein
VSGEAQLEFDCFGGRVEVRAAGAGAAVALEAARARLLRAHRHLSRFDPQSELSRLNQDPRRAVPASPLLRRLALAVHEAGALSDGLVDGTLLREIERAGYASSLAAEPLPWSEPPRPPSASTVAGPSERADWATVTVDEAAGTVVRPPGVWIDGGGLAKGLLADLVAADLAGFPSFAVNCCGDLRFGGGARRERTVLVSDPRGGEPLEELHLCGGALATSGTSRRSWLGPDGSPAHQIIDPRSGRPAFTGVVQATAIGPTALDAEVYAKSALLAGPVAGVDWLPHGGVLVLDDGSVETVRPARIVAGAAS